MAAEQEESQEAFESHAETAVSTGVDEQKHDDERGARILASLQFSREQYVEDVADMESGPFSRTVMEKYDKRVETMLRVG